MKKNTTRFLPRQSGASAVELALILPILIVLLTAPLFFAIFFWHYTTVQKAVQDGARYLSSISEQDMRDPELAAASAEIAREIIRAETAELIPATNRINIVLNCGTAANGVTNLCTGVGDGDLPENVAVSVQFYLKDDIFALVNTGRYGWSVSAIATVPYVGK
jgi:Flp pilus assembly protein TadG